MKRENTKNRRLPDAAILRAIERKRYDLYSNYDLPPDQKERAEMLFAEMERIGGECRDLNEFNEIFFHQTLSREFYKLMLDNGIFVRMPAAQPAHSISVSQHTRKTEAMKGARFRRLCGRLFLAVDK